jgi:hypothetical protein
VPQPTGQNSLSTLHKHATFCPLKVSTIACGQMQNGSEHKHKQTALWAFIMRRIHTKLSNLFFKCPAQECPFQKLRCSEDNATRPQQPTGLGCTRTIVSEIFSNDQKGARLYLSLSWCPHIFIQQRMLHVFFNMDHWGHSWWCDHNPCCLSVVLPCNVSRWLALLLSCLW